MKLLVLSLMLLSCTVLANVKVENVLDRFHQAAAKADYNAYLGLLTEDAIYLGTDSSERWNKAEFAAFVAPYFNKGQGWLYQPIERSITVIEQNGIYFFDELLENKNYGRCRGSGVVVKTPAGWKIKQYNLSIPVPNAIALDIVGKIKTHRKSLTQ